MPRNGCGPVRNFVANIRERRSNSCATNYAPSYHACQSVSQASMPQAPSSFSSLHHSPSHSSNQLSQQASQVDISENVTLNHDGSMSVEIKGGSSSAFKIDTLDQKFAQSGHWSRSCSFSPISGSEKTVSSKTSDYEFKVTYDSKGEASIQIKFNSNVEKAEICFFNKQTCQYQKLVVDRGKLKTPEVDTKVEQATNNEQKKTNDERVVQEDSNKVENAIKLENNNSTQPQEVNPLIGNKSSTNNPSNSQAEPLIGHVSEQRNGSNQKNNNPGSGQSSPDLGNVQQKEDLNPPIGNPQSVSPVGQGGLNNCNASQPPPVGNNSDINLPNRQVALSNNDIIKQISGVLNLNSGFKDLTKEQADSINFNTNPTTGALSNPAAFIVAPNSLNPTYHVLRNNIGSNKAGIMTVDFSSAEKAPELIAKEAYRLSSKGDTLRFNENVNASSVGEINGVRPNTFQIRSDGSVLVKFASELKGSDTHIVRPLNNTNGGVTWNMVAVDEVNGQIIKRGASPTPNESNSPTIGHRASNDSIISKEKLEEILLKLDTNIKVGEQESLKTAAGIFNQCRKDYGEEGVKQLNEAYKEKYGNYPAKLIFSYNGKPIFQELKLMEAIYGEDVMSATRKVHEIDGYLVKKDSAISFIEELKSKGILDSVREAWDVMFDVKKYPSLSFDGEIKEFTSFTDSELQDLYSGSKKKDVRTNQNHSEVEAPHQRYDTVW